MTPLKAGMQVYGASKELSVNADMGLVIQLPE